MKQIRVHGLDQTEAIAEMIDHILSLYENLPVSEKQTIWPVVEKLNEKTVMKKDYELQLENMKHPGEDALIERYQNAFEGDEDGEGDDE